MPTCSASSRYARILHQMKDTVLAGSELERAGAASAALARVFGDGVRPLRLEQALFDAALQGWRRQQGGRHLADSTKRSRELVVRRFREHTERWPWEWQPIDVDEWIEDLGAPPRRRAVSTLRHYQGALRGFTDYLADDRYPWVAICEHELGARRCRSSSRTTRFVASATMRAIPAAGHSRARS